MKLVKVNVTDILSEADQVELNLDGPQETFINAEKILYVMKGSKGTVLFADSHIFNVVDETVPEVIEKIMKAYNITIAKEN